MCSKEVKEAIRQHFEVPETIQRLVNMATSDLLWGPIGLDDEWEEENYKGFRSACKRIREEFTESLPRELWVDVDCGCVMTREPQGEEVDGEYIEPYWESIYYVNGHNELIELLFNHYVVGYI